MPQYPAYLFAYFAGEDFPDAEQVHFAVSSEDAPLSFTPLAGGKPVLQSTLGTGGVRDPFLVRNELAAGFHLIGTDLSIHNDGDWERATRYGSRSVVMWDSPDLVSWSEPRLVEIAPSNAGCAWAPEAFLDRDRGAYVVFWSSPLYGEERTGASAHLRVLRCFTKDFRSFSDPEVYLDPGHSVIDTTFLERDGVTYRFTKDERPQSAGALMGKHIFEEASRDGMLADNFTLVAEGVGSAHLAQGEGPIAVNSPDGQKSYLIIDEFGGRGYVAFQSEDPGTGAWEPVADARLPEGARHGSLLPITSAERSALLAV
ncbi:hypothetical protein GCM10027403_13600 [Arthrobacter tecti]